jgi:hypothetical protein
MKSKTTQNSNQFIKRSIYGLMFFLCLFGCKKQNGPAPVIAIKFPQQAVITAVLKANTTDQEFNDLDFNSMQVANLNGKAYLAKIKSKSDNSKVLIYSKKNGIIHARWVQVKPGTSPSSGVMEVSSVNESTRIESSFSKGAILSSRLFVNKEVLAKLNLTGKTTSASNASTNLSVAGSKVTGARVLDDTVDGGDGGGNDLGSGDGTFDGGDGNTDPSLEITDGSGGGGGGGGPSSDPDIAYTIDLTQDVIITATADDGTSITLYSLYTLFGNNLNYLGQYSTDPTGLNGDIVTVAPLGTVKGVDKNFVKGQKLGTPLLIYDVNPDKYLVSVGYNITTVNGVTTINVTSIGANEAGLNPLISWTTVATSSLVTGSIINFTISGTENYAATQAVGNAYFVPLEFTGTYDTSTGAYTITLKNSK